MTSHHTCSVRPAATRDGSGPHDISPTSPAEELSPDVFFFFSNRLGCLGSLVLSAIVTIVLLYALSR